MRDALALAAAAAGLALAFAWLNPWACLLGNDAELWAVAADRGPVVAAHLARQPGYPALVAAVSWLTADVPRAAFAVSAASCAATVALLYRVAGGGRAGLVAACAGLTAPAWAPAAQSVAECTMAALFVVALWVAIEDARHPSIRLAALAGAVLGLAAITKPNAAPAILGLAAAVLTTGGAVVPPARIARLVAMLADFALPVAAWALFEWWATGVPSRAAALVARDVSTGADPASFGPMGNLLALARTAVWFTPAIAGLAWARSLRPEVRVPLLVAVSLLPALIAPLHERHLVPYLLALSVAGAAAAPRALAVVSLVAVPLHAAVVFPGWQAAGRTDRCDGPVAEAGAWLREHADPLDPASILAQRAPAVRAYAGFRRGDEAWALAAIRGDGPVEPGATLWLVTGDGHPSLARAGRQPLHPRAEAVAEGDSWQVWRLSP